ncbi:phage portal protein [Wenxinia marina]|uniref:Phage portal protein, lambda family n=1 Tax=Wenxinia marina DSM 24838 TaxID=1123501 RepID=A0A0D0QHK1_9RHOB|nr:phage portal protein [Wenxinia marina]KIQ70558.1 phage portal protein, lambda family [Wenxinia marina DSM 24838]GGL52170.1 phage portal protein [Wenxinia marina]
MAFPFLPKSFVNRFTRDAPEPSRVRRVDAAAVGRRGRSMAVFGSVNPEVAAGGRLSRERARYLAVNQPFLTNGTHNWITALVGTGIRPTPRAPNAELGFAFDAWAEEADHAGRADFWGLQATIARHLVVDGEALILLHDTPDGLRLQVIPPEQLDESRNARLGDDREIVQGVEFDAQGRRVAYHILPQQPTATFEHYAPPVRVDAADVLHIVQPIAAGQVRGLSWLAAAVLTANEFDQLLDALLVGAKIAAMHAGFITDTTNMGGIGAAFPDADGLSDISLEPGVVRVLPGGCDIKFSSPEAAKDSPAFVRMNLLALAAALGLPEHMLSGDLTNANYSSLRAGLLPFRARVEQTQYGVLVPQLLRPVWRRWLASEVVAGRLDVSPDIRAEWIMPRQAQVDPAKDMTAVKEALSMGLMSRSQAVAEMGWNAADLDAEIAADHARERELGLTFTDKESGDA